MYHVQVCSVPGAAELRLRLHAVWPQPSVDADLPRRLCGAVSLGSVAICAADTGAKMGARRAVWRVLWRLHAHVRCVWNQSVILNHA